jgi:hypothetical protein
MTSETIAPPRLLDGTELMGRVAGSGLGDAPYLVRRRGWSSRITPEQVAYVYTSNTAVAGNSSHGFINALNGNQVQILTLGSSNGNAAFAG